MTTQRTLVALRKNSSTPSPDMKTLPRLSFPELFGQGTPFNLENIYGTHMVLHLSDNTQRNEIC